ncbi:MAG TPA: hypothetical protein VMS84_05205 [Mycobacterium sp.]|jgi:hypothetical protein|nr:hypothetical protein [Mycobacterium sp.]
MDSDDPEERIRELERRLAEPKAAPRESFPPPSPGLMAPPPLNRAGYARLRRQIDRRRRVGAIWGVFVVPGILLLLVIVFHLYR